MLMSSGADGCLALRRFVVSSHGGRRVSSDDSMRKADRMSPSAHFDCTCFARLLLREAVLVEVLGLCLSIGLPTVIPCS